MKEKLTTTLKFTIFSKGYYRTVYLTSAPQTEPVVVKMLNWRYDFTYDYFEYMRMDAIVNEKLNGNPEIVHSYAFCGNIIIGEAMVLGDLLKVAFPSNSYFTGCARNHRLNNVSVSEL